MALFSKIRGTIETFFQVGLGASALKSNSAALESRLADDSAFAVHRVATPVAANDAATKGYVDGLAGPQVVQTIRMAVANTPATQSSSTSIPANARVLDARLEVGTAFPGATISIGRTGSAALIQATGDNLATAVGDYQVMQDTDWGGSALPVLVTIAGAPASGAGFVLVQYATPAA